MPISYKVKLYYTDTNQTLDSNGEIDPTLLSSLEVDIFNVNEEPINEIEESTNPSYFRSYTGASYYDYVLTTTTMSLQVGKPQFLRSLNNVKKYKFIYLGFDTSSKYPNADEFTITPGYAFPVGIVSEEQISQTKVIFKITLSKEINELSI